MIPKQIGTLTPVRERKRTCTPDIIAFLNRVKRTLDNEKILDSINVSAERFKLIGLEGDVTDIGAVLSKCNKYGEIAISAQDNLISFTKLR